MLPGAPQKAVKLQLEMTDFDIDYADEEQLEELLQSVDRPGGFCTHGRVFVPMPALEVEGVGLLSSPFRFPTSRFASC